MTETCRDCFQGPDQQITAGEALARLKAQAQPVTAVETVPLAEAAGRILAATPAAVRPIPAYDNSAVDGYAFRHDPHLTRFKVIGRAAAGHPFAGAVGPGEAVRIFTGAAMPEGADTVAMQEVAVADGQWVTLPPGLTAGDNRRFAGEDVKAGDRPLALKTRLRPQEVAILAAMGVPEVAVHRRLSVAVFSSGDEIREPGSPLPPGGVYDANRYFLRATLKAWGHEVHDLGILADDKAVVTKALLEAAEAYDVVLTSAGASQGDEDHIVRTVETHGRLHFWRLAIKPGRPLALGNLGRAAFIGLPGNPVAVALGLMRFARPVLEVMAGAPWSEPMPSLMPAAFAMTKKAGRREYLRGRRRMTDHGVVAERFALDGSGIISSLIAADGFIELDEDITEIKVGDTVSFLPFSEFGLPFGTPAQA